jgi:hypothetical protein
LEKLAGERDLPRDILHVMHQITRRRKDTGLSETQVRERLNQLQELHILPEHRVQPGLNSDGQQETPALAAGELWCTFTCDLCTKEEYRIGLALKEKPAARMFPSDTRFSTLQDGESGVSSNASGS